MTFFWNRRSTNYRRESHISSRRISYITFASIFVCMYKSNAYKMSGRLLISHLSAGQPAARVRRTRACSYVLTHTCNEKSGGFPFEFETLIFNFLSHCKCVLDPVWTTILFWIFATEHDPIWIYLSKIHRRSSNLSEGVI